jgi:enoyl-CoA hydratase/carnithine racemase
MSERLFGLIGQIGTNDEVRAAVLTGAGPRSFSVGSDVGEVDAYPDPWQFRNRRDYCDALRALRKPVIAAVNGYAYGGGVSALLAASVPASDAALLLLTGDPVDAAEAHRIGLVSRVYSPEELVPAARSLALTIAARPPVAAQAAKANLLAARSMGLSRLSSTNGRCRLSAWGLAMPWRGDRPLRRSGCLSSPVTEERT